MISINRFTIRKSGNYKTIPLIIKNTFREHYKIVSLNEQFLPELRTTALIRIGNSIVGLVLINTTVNLF